MKKLIICVLGISNCIAVYGMENEPMPCKTERTTNKWPEKKEDKTERMPAVRAVNGEKKEEGNLPRGNSNAPLYAYWYTDTPCGNSPIYWIEVDQQGQMTVRTIEGFDVPVGLGFNPDEP